MAFLGVKNLSVTLGGTSIVHDISFDVEEGEVLAIVGPNGAGKTTLMKALLGLTPHTGEVLWKQPMRIGYVPQHFTFDRNFPITVEELFLLKIKGAKLFWEDRRSVRTKIGKLLAEVKGKDLIDKPLGTLSGGELQRVFIAFALATNPNILFFDEPSSGIDIGGEETVYTLIHELSVQKHLTIILISHDLDIVYEHASNVVCLNRRMVCSGIPREALTAQTIDALYGRHASVYQHAPGRHFHREGHDPKEHE